MGIGISTNIASLRAQYALSQSVGKFKQALTRLSTGLRINTGADDVVGLASSNSLITQIRGMTQAKLNINSVGGVLNVAEGYLSQLTELAQEMREVAVQAAEPMLSASMRTTLSTNFNTLMNEFDRLTDNADYNGVALFGSGAFGNGLSSTIQMGPDANDTLTITIADTRIEAIGRVAIYTAQTRTAVSTSAVASVSFVGPDAAMTVNSVAVPIGAYTDDGVSNVGGDESAIAYVNAINSVSQTSGVRATVVSNVYTVDYSAGNGLESNQHLIINGVTVKSDTLSVSVADDNDASSLVSMINTFASETGVDADLDTATDSIILTATDGRNIHLQISAAGATSSSYNVFGITGADTNTQMAQRGTFRLEADSAFDIDNAEHEFTGGAVQAVAMDEYGDDPNGTTTLNRASIATAESSGYALTILNNVITQIQNRRADVGGFMGRLDSAERELDARIQSMEEAKSFIREADLAEETSKMTQYQIMQQAGVTVLAQANTIPQMALALLNKR